MEYFLEGIAPNENEKITKRKYYLQGTVPIRHLLNTKMPLKSWQRPVINELIECILR